MGAPRSTILGPLLFILYVNDILRVLKRQCIVSYVDDRVVRDLKENMDRSQKQYYLIIISKRFGIND